MGNKSCLWQFETVVLFKIGEEVRDMEIEFRSKAKAHLYRGALLTVFNSTYVFSTNLAFCGKLFLSEPVSNAHASQNISERDELLVSFPHVCPKCDL